MTILKVVLVFLAAAAGGVIIGIVLGNLLNGAIKTDHGRNQIPDSFSSPANQEAIPPPVLSPEIGD